MGYAYIRATKPLTASGQAENLSGGGLPSPVTIKGVYAVGGTTPSALRLYDGVDNTGTLVLELPLTESTSPVVISSFPGKGLNCQVGLYVELDSATSAVVFYEA